jgi:transcriptional regulator with XRE-family HTH domain
VPRPVFSYVLKQIGANVRSLRINSGRTQAELAELVDISHRHEQAIELGTIAPSLRTLVDIAAALNVPMSAFFQRAPRTKPKRGRPPKKERPQTK